MQLPCIRAASEAQTDMYKDKLCNRLTIFPSGTPLEGLGGALQLVAPLTQSILAVVNPSFHMRREHLHQDPIQDSVQVPEQKSKTHKQTVRCDTG